MSRIETLPADKLSQMFYVLAELPQKVLAKMNTALLPKDIKVPSNVYTKDWIPQYKTLCKLFMEYLNALF